MTAMLRLIRFVVLFLFYWASLIAHGENTPKQLTHDQALKDTKAFISLLEATHPDPYTNLGGKIAFKRKAQDLIRDLPVGGISVPELTERMGEFLAPLRDGHTRVRGSRSNWEDPAPRLAVQFGIVSDGLVITASDLAELKGTQGDRLMAVNGHSIGELTNRMSRQVATENEYGTYYGVTLALRSFKLLKNLIPDLERNAGVRYTLEDENSNKLERTIRWDGEHPENPEKWSETPRQWSGLSRSDQPFYYRFLDNGIAYLRVANMMPREGYEVMKGYKVGDLKATLEEYYKKDNREMPADLDAAIQGVPSLTEPATEMLKKMKQQGTPNVIIDLRGNGGGSTPVIVPFFYEMYGDDYFGRNDDAEFVTVKSQLYLDKYHSSVEEERKKDPNFEVGEYVFENGNEPGTAVEKRDKKFAEWNSKGLNWVKPLETLNGKPLYRPAKVIVLCDPGTFSAAFQAMFLLHQMGATVVGVPSAQSPNAFMEATPFVLPESGIKGSISNGMQLFMPHDPTANVYHPDFELSYAILAKYGADMDASLHYALDLIEAGRI